MIISNLNFPLSVNFRNKLFGLYFIFKIAILSHPITSICLLASSILINYCFSLCWICSQGTLPYAQSTQFHPWGFSFPVMISLHLWHSRLMSHLFSLISNVFEWPQNGHFIMQLYIILVTIRSKNSISLRYNWSYIIIVFQFQKYNVGETNW